jgi:aspartate-semialdehyde dehydrogenase
MGKTAIIARATGLVGERLLELLLQDPAYAKVIALSRRRLAVNDSKLEQILVDFDELQTLTPTRHVEDVFCSLGTTIKEAGSRAAFRKVDFSTWSMSPNLVSRSALEDSMWFLRWERILNRALFTCG